MTVFSRASASFPASRSTTRFVIVVGALALLMACSRTPSLFGQTNEEAIREESPHLFHKKNGDVVARWITKGQLVERRFAKGKKINLPEFRDLVGPAFKVEKHQAQRATWSMPKRLLALSDVEGQYDRMRAFLRRHGVIDKTGSWAFGKGHFVCVGDMVDRGTQVTETLLLVHRLDREARRAGGRVHFVVGNHEAMMMGGDVRYTAKKYAAVATRLGITIPGLLGADTEIGRWLRRQNAVVRIGDLVFVHAGLAPEVVDDGFDFEKFNATIRLGLGGNRRKLDADVAQLVWGGRGPLWYRGYFPAHAGRFGPTPTVEQMETQLRRLGGTSVVIGHTKVRHIDYIDTARRILAIDTTWTSDRRAAALLVENGRRFVLPVKGNRKELAMPRPVASKAKKN